MPVTVEPAPAPAPGADSARTLLFGPLLGGGALVALAGVLHADADRVRIIATELAGTAAGTGWHSVAADACRARLAGFGLELLTAATRLETAADAVARHAATATRRAESLLGGAWDLVQRAVLAAPLL